MSKKKLLLYKKYYLPAIPTQLHTKRPKEGQKKPTRPFRDVISHLMEHKYIQLTDAGYLNLLPKGVFLQDAIAARAQKIMEQEGALRYRFASVFSGRDALVHTGLLSKFEDRVFMLQAGETNSEYLKYASDPLIFKYLAGRSIPTPHKIYSPDYFFRAIQSGELKSLIQPREFFMTDFHYFVEHNDFDTYAAAASLSARTVTSLTGKDEWYLNIDTYKDFFDSHESEIINLLDTIGAPAIINVTSERTHYYSIQFQYIVDYYCGNETQLANLQFDQKNGELFAIKSVATGQSVSIVHGTLFGRTEKVMGLIFGKQIERMHNKLSIPVLPLWLTPIVARIILLETTPEISQFVHIISKRLSESACRYDIDMRDLPLAKKIRDAEHDWIPYHIVIGKQECASHTLSVRNRSLNQQSLISIEDFILQMGCELNVDDKQPQTTPRLYRGDEMY